MPKLCVLFQMHVSDIEARNKERQRNIRQACSSTGTPQPTSFKVENIAHNVFFENTHGVLFCGIAKVSSTFWTEMLAVLRKGDTYDSPFQLNLSMARKIVPRFEAVKKAFRKQKLKRMLEISTSFMFTRDPYARLYSGYVNKIYSPNMMYWKMYGRKIAQTTKVNPSNMSLAYGHDISFRELIQYLLQLWKDGKRIDNHFRSMSEQCDPCAMPFDFIGQLETLKQDAEYLLQTWRSQYSDFKLEFNDFENESFVEMSKRRITVLFKARSAIIKMGYPLHNIFLRLWSDFQIRGFISKQCEYPFTKSETMNVTENQLVDAVKSALGRRHADGDVKGQRQEAMIQAYRTIPLYEMEQLQRYVRKDCKLFGYDERPQTLFDRRTSPDSNHLYLKGL